MNKVINMIGMSIIAAKYAIFALLAGVTFYTGISTAETMLLVGIDGNE
ncbi:hypothetical protein P7F88_09570 [Vibrio hannami]|nr:hypothetical protein [Vibrio hannami]MDG3086342.1 hypothetical protein [Vibrio hannami]